MHFPKFLFFTIISIISIVFLLMLIIDLGFWYVFYYSTLAQILITGYTVCQAISAITSNKEENSPGFIQDSAFKWVFGLSFALAVLWFNQWFRADFELTGNFFDNLKSFWLHVGLFMALEVDLISFDHQVGNFSATAEVVIIVVITGAIAILEMFFWYIANLGANFGVSLGIFFSQWLSLFSLSVAGYGLGFAFLGKTLVNSS